MSKLIYCIKAKLKEKVANRRPSIKLGIYNMQQYPGWECKQGDTVVKSRLTASCRNALGKKQQYRVAENPSLSELLLSCCIMG